MKIGPGHRIVTAASWPLGIAWTSWGYIWRVTPLHRREIEGSLGEDLPPALPAGVSLDEVHTPEDGAGPLLHRTYTGSLREGELDADELMRRLSANPDEVAPRALAKFRKTRGPRDRMTVGDEFLVHMPGPWDGPVRVVELTPTSFRFATLTGHLEAGQIEWRARDESGRVVFQIESWARAGDRLSALLHGQLLMAKEVQLHMWTSVIERVAKLARARLESGIDIETRRVEWSSGIAASAAARG
jgi:hypothetical protein